MLVNVFPDNRVTNSSVEWDILNSVLERILQYLTYAIAQNDTSSNTHFMCNLFFVSQKNPTKSTPIPYF